MSGSSRSSIWDFQPTPKLAGTELVAPLAETQARVQKIASRVPITRVSDLTPLDPLGLPVFSAVTPLAEDLTSHLGKGTDAPSARVSALMEAIERVSAQAPPPGPTLRQSFAALADGGYDTVDPSSLALPGDSAYDPDRVFTWAESYDLVRRGPIWMACDLVTSPPVEGILREVDTNGLASGNTRLQAATHAICEVIERDAWSQHEFVEEFGDARAPLPPARGIDLETLPEAAGSWAERILDSGFEFSLQSITTEIGVATFRAFMTDPLYPTPEGPQPLHFPGYGTHPNAAIAALRAVTETVQARLAVIQGARDAYNTSPPSKRRDTSTLRRRQLALPATSPFSKVASAGHDDLLEDLRFVVAQLQRCGFDRIVATDLTRPDLDIPVVRVRVPGLSAFVVNRRRVDWRCLRYLL